MPASDKDRVKLSFGLLCSDRDLGLSLASSLIQQKVKECPLECQITYVDSTRNLDGIAGDLLWILVLDLTSNMSCNNIPRAIDYLVSSGLQEKFCIALYNYHKMQERYRDDLFVQDMLRKTPCAPFLTCSLTKKSEDYLAQRILQWAMIAGGYRGLLSPVLLPVTRPSAILKRSVEESSGMDISS